MYGNVQVKKPSSKMSDWPGRCFPSRLHGYCRYSHAAVSPMDRWESCLQLSMTHKPRCLPWGSKGFEGSANNLESRCHRGSILRERGPRQRRSLRSQKGPQHHDVVRAQVTGAL